MRVAQVTSTENKLSTLYEYVDDTEDYVEIQQDNRRNQLIKLDLLVCVSALTTMRLLRGPECDGETICDTHVIVAVLHSALPQSPAHVLRL